MFDLVVLFVSLVYAQTQQTTAVAQLSKGACTQTTDAALCSNCVSFVQCNGTVVTSYIGPYALSTISTYFASLPGLQSITLNNAQISGTIPTELGMSLLWFDSSLIF
jgi:hypothetical protein